MGYHTDFEGAFKLETPLTQDQINFIQAFSDTRRMARDPLILKESSNDLHRKAQLPLGPQGDHYVNAGGHAGQDHTDDIINYNMPPESQPSLWNGWTCDEFGYEIIWNEMEKFYEYVEWIEYMIEHFIKPWGNSITGEMKWFGEDRDDMGIIIIKDNVVETKEATVTYQ